MRRYNFPDHTGNFVSADLFKRLAYDFPLLRGDLHASTSVQLYTSHLQSHLCRSVKISLLMTPFCIVVPVMLVLHCQVSSREKARCLFRHISHAFAFTQAVLFEGRLAAVHVLSG